MRWATRSARRCLRPSWSAPFATPGAAASTWPSRRASPTRPWQATLRTRSSSPANSYASTSRLGPPASSTPDTPRRSASAMVVPSGWPSGRICRFPHRRLRPTAYRSSPRGPAPPLRQGDRLVFLPDGVLERNAAAVDAMSILTASRDLHPREAVQDLTRCVVEACGGNLRDDATILCLDWHGGPPRLRQASEGADW